MSRSLYYLGPEETFSEQAARLLGRCSGETFELQPVKTLQQAIRGAIAGEAQGDCAVLPYYNLYEGLIQETLDLITEHQLAILAAQRVAIRFALGGYTQSQHSVGSGATGKTGKTGDSGDFEIIFSHPKALAQCSDYLGKHFPQAEQRESGSTAAAVEQLAASHNGLAIARAEAFEKRGIPILAEDIGNRQYGRANYTEFLMIGRPVRIFPEAERYRTMVAIIPNVDRVGLLGEILGQIAFFGINLLKIHSRPALSEHETKHDPQMFYLEMASRADSREFRLCRESLDLRLGRTGPDGEGSVRLLGEYPLFD